eukprot:725161-Amphidinium_carterae.1
MFERSSAAVRHDTHSYLLTTCNDLLPLTFAYKTARKLKIIMMMKNVVLIMLMMRISMMIIYEYIDEDDDDDDGQTHLRLKPQQCKHHSTERTLNLKRGKTPWKSRSQLIFRRSGRALVIQIGEVLCVRCVTSTFHGANVPVANLNDEPFTWYDAKMQVNNHHRGTTSRD